MAAHHQGVQVRWSCWSSINAGVRSLGGGAAHVCSFKEASTTGPAEWCPTWITAISGSSGFRVTSEFAHQVYSDIYFLLALSGWGGGRNRGG